MRKEIDITISTKGRDFGKIFHIREMGAAAAEKWAMRALLALTRSGVDLPEGIELGGMQAIAAAGLQTLLRVSFDDIEVLLDEMMDCISIKPDPKNPHIVRALVDDDIEEIATRLLLRKAVIDLHVDFFSTGAPSTQTSATSDQASSSSNTPTSQEPSVRYSQRGKPR